MSYSEKLLHPLWQKKRLEILDRDKFTCQLCKDTETTLHVHHKAYIKGKEPWDYPKSNFQTLCSVCHNDITLIQKERKFTDIKVYINNENTRLYVFYDKVDGYPYVNFYRRKIRMELEYLISFGEGYFRELLSGFIVKPKKRG